MQFVPFWTNILRSRKVAAMPDDLYRTWTYCLLAAQEFDNRGGTLPPTDDLSYALHMETSELMSRLSRLSRDGFLEERDGVYTIHDWDDWKHRPDPTAAARKRAQRERNRLKPKGDPPKPEGDNASDDVTVTAVTQESHACHAPTQLNSTQLTTPPPTPRDGGVACAGDDLEPFDPGPATLPLPAAAVLPPDKQRVLDRQLDRWGASNGDRVISDLLKDYPAEIVAAACDFHYFDNDGVLDARRLRGICREMLAGRWKIPEKSHASRKQKPEPEPVFHKATPNWKGPKPA